MQNILDRLEEKREAARAGGGVRRVEAQHRRGKLTARERLELLLDPGSFEEWDMFVEHRSHDFGIDEHKIPGDGVVTGYGTVNGRLVFVFSQDFTVFGGSLSEAHAEKICKIMDQAMNVGAPVIGLNDSGGARIQDGVASLAGYAEVFERNVLASGVIPQISMIMGPCAGGAVYSPAMTDFIFMVKDTSYLFVTGPEVVKTVTHETVTQEELGGALTHTTRSGVADLAFENDVEALIELRRFIDFLPASNRAQPPLRPTADPSDRVEPSLDTLVPSSAEQALRHEGADREGRRRRRFLRDPARFRAQHPDRLRPDGRHDDRHRRQPADGARRLPRHRQLPQGGSLCAVLRLLQHPDRDVCRCARVPARNGPGAWRHHQARREAAVRLCRSDRAEGHLDHPQGLWRRLRRDELEASAGRHQFAWPSAEIAVMGPKGAVEIIFRADLGDKAAIEARTEEYREKFANPFVAASRGFIDDVILPRETRRRLCRALAMLRGKQLANPPKKHDNIPL